MKTEPSDIEHRNTRKRNIKYNALPNSYNRFT